MDKATRARRTALARDGIVERIRLLGERLGVQPSTLNAITFPRGKGEDRLTNQMVAINDALGELVEVTEMVAETKPAKKPPKP